MNRSSSTTRTPQPARSQLVAFVCFGLILTGAVLTFCIMHYGQVTGEEFSPDNFTRRTFSYYEIPVIGLQVLPIDRQDHTNDLERFLTSQNLVSELKTTDANRRWDLVVANRGNSEQQKFTFSEGDARILCSYLDAQNANKENIWLEWTKQNKDLGKIVWPIVAKLARQELYMFIPDLLLAARGASDADALQERLNQQLAEKYVELANTQQRLGQHQPAVELFTEAISLAPRQARAFAGRAKSLAILGEKDRATADLAQAEKFNARR